ncbi:MAG: hypothetical protein AAFQ80_16235 [Cyanobacteria bacterium J06621_8]
MPNYRPPNRNRLLALEQELLEKKRWAKGGQNRQHSKSLKQEQIKQVSRKPYLNNRLLQLEQDTLGRDRRSQRQKKALKIEKKSGDRIIRNNNKSQQVKSKSSRVKSQVFDTGEPIILQYNTKALSVTSPPAAVNLPEETAVEKVIIEPLPIPELPLDDQNEQNSFTLNLADSDQPPLIGEPVIISQRETFAPELPIIPEPEASQAEIEPETEESFTLKLVDSDQSPPVAEPDISKQRETSALELPAIPESTASQAEIEPETENPLSQAAELISKIDSQPYPLQPEDLPPLIAELESEAAPATPPKEPEKDKPAVDSPEPQNPHAIFDRMGKNMAYATTFDVGTVELEQLFDEFDSTLDAEEQANQDSSFAEALSNLELEQRFDEFDRALDRAENVPTATEQTAEAKSLSEIPSPPGDIQPETSSTVEAEKTTNITPEAEPELEPKPETIHSQNQPSEIIPVSSQPPEPLETLSYDAQLEPETPPQANVKVETLLFRTGINLISLILRWLNLLRQRQIERSPEINSTPTLYPNKDYDQSPTITILPISNEPESPDEEMTQSILSPQRAIAKSANIFPSDKDPLTGMPNYQSTEHNSYPLLNYPHQKPANANSSEAENNDSS